MNVDPVTVFRSANGTPAKEGEVRVAPGALASIPGRVSSGENNQPSGGPSVSTVPQDEVKMQWDTPDQIVVYQFVNQQGNLILQVPSEQMLSLAHQISEELLQENAPKKPAGSEEGGTNGH